MTTRKQLYVYNIYEYTFSCIHKYICDAPPVASDESLDREIERERERERERSHAQVDEGLRDREAELNTETSKEYQADLHQIDVHMYLTHMYI